ncbi:MAG TPA: hypothetical protein VFW41_10355 [Gaiellaceae bacterium]|nr:hypothetical protein [Gaiellaceae bacterium]
MNPALVMEAAIKTKFPIALAMALLSQESSGGHNEWGHDKTIFAAGQDKLHGKNWGDDPVTKQAYLAYKAERATGGNQGVGPMQLTYPSYQDAADKHGGAWKPLPNMVEGFSVVKHDVQRGGLRLGLASYNAGAKGAYTPAGQHYASSVLRLEADWARALGVPSLQNAGY